MIYGSNGCARGEAKGTRGEVKEVIELFCWEFRRMWKVFQRCQGCDVLEKRHDVCGGWRRFDDASRDEGRDS